MATQPGLNQRKKDGGGYNLRPAPRIGNGEGSRYSTKAPGTGQHYICGIQNVNQENEHDLKDIPSIK